VGNKVGNVAEGSVWRGIRERGGVENPACPCKGKLEDFLGKKEFQRMRTFRLIPKEKARGGQEEKK